MDPSRDGRPPLQVAQQAHLARLLAASMSVCDAPRLLLGYQAWLALLLDALLKPQRDALLALVGAPQQAGGAGSSKAAGEGNGADASGQEQPAQPQQQQQRKRPWAAALMPGGGAGGAGAPQQNAGAAAALAGAVAATCHAVTHVFTR